MGAGELFWQGWRCMGKARTISLILILSGCAPSGPDAWQICRAQFPADPDAYSNCLGNLALGTPTPNGLGAVYAPSFGDPGSPPPVTCSPFGAGLSCNSIGSAQPPVNLVPNGQGWTIYQAP